MDQTSDPKKAFKTRLKNMLSSSECPPFLFVGSGVSIRYCSIPTWIGLLKGFVENNKECFKHKFGYYSSKCSNDPLKIASSLAEEFHAHWWQSDEYEDSRNDYSEIASKDIETAFKIELAKYVETRKQLNEGLEEEISLISQAVISGILTTNWDDFLQEIFPEFQTQIGQKEAIFADHKSIGELYKIHGCTSKPESLVVTSSDYNKFMENNHYLNAKLLTLFAEYPILFLGYSLSDPNIELILKNLISCLDKDLFHIEKLQNRLFFVEWQSSPCNPSIETSSYTSNSIIIPLVKIKAHDYKEIWEVLADLPRTLSVKTLRQLQKMVFEFVTTSKPTGKILVQGIEELEKIDELEVVVGFGNISKLQERGIVGLKARDLLEDILFGQLQEQNYPEIVKKVLPSVIRQNVFIPFFKYQRATSNLNADNSLKAHTFNNYTLTRANTITIEDYRVDTGRTRMTNLGQTHATLESMLKALTPIHAVQAIPYLPKEKIDLTALRSFLKDNWSEFGAKENSYSSPYRKCICLLDFLEYANHN
ncbi:hypothetical protein DYBT9275_04816 [Dyadobacter sp. CECT 9275]|uniref:SIR2-like domain-containing protein n=1 Tax=Dyadobacter helix TaxID=2822344 RepID=A0A916NDH1_9BACT|nr:SIR2 family protein [Dyadobacter sp. CECT 9275]CAG5010795.1 hypothetical protein DYBT9275_04816 [Dyadobacter sp. CECT 9275]